MSNRSESLLRVRVSYLDSTRDALKGSDSILRRGATLFSSHLDFSSELTLPILKKLSFDLVRPYSPSRIWADMGTRFDHTVDQKSSLGKEIQGTERGLSTRKTSRLLTTGFNRSTGSERHRMHDLLRMMMSSRFHITGLRVGSQRPNYIFINTQNANTQVRAQGGVCTMLSLDSSTFRLFWMSPAMDVLVPSERHFGRYVPTTRTALVGAV